MNLTIRTSNKKRPHGSLSQMQKIHVPRIRLYPDFFEGGSEKTFFCLQEEGNLYLHIYCYDKFFTTNSLFKLWWGYGGICGGREETTFIIS
jgi:hypothetical protein